MGTTVTTKRHGIENCIKAIGQSLINKAEDIARDTKDVIEITINARLTADEIISFNVEKTYIARLPNEDN